MQKSFLAKVSNFPFPAEASLGGLPQKSPSRSPAFREGRQSYEFRHK